VHRGSFARLRFADIAAGLLAAGSGLAIGLYLLVTALRLRYPFELEWMEGGAVDHVARILDGRRLYLAPSIDFVPFVYPPLYFYLSAALAKVIGLGFLPLRLVSLASSLACLALLFRIVARETGCRRAGLCAAGLYAATFAASGAWFDLARVDSLFVALLLGGLERLRFGDRSAGGSIAAGVLLALAFLAKQTALPIAVAVLLHAVLTHRKHVWPAIAAFVLAAALPALALEFASRGWYSYYVFRLPGQHPLDGKWITFFSRDLLRTVPLAGVISAVFLARQALRRGRPESRPRITVYLIFLATSVAASYASRLHEAGYLNVLMPAFAALSLVTGLAVGAALSTEASTKTAWGEMGRGAVGLLCLLQLLLLAYNPRPLVPTAADRQAGQALVRRLAALPGEVYIPFHGYLAALAGKPTHAQGMAVYDVLRGENPQAGALAASLHQAIRDQRFAAVVLDSNLFLPQLTRYYRPTETVFDRPSVFFPVTGKRTRPEQILTPAYAAATTVATP
jgi:hypothetical protein